MENYLSKISIAKIEKIFVGTILLAANIQAYAGLPIQHWTTAAGARVYFVEARSLPMLDLSVEFAAGSSRDPANRSGTASMAAGLMTNGNMADYLVPMAAEMPDIVVAHVETPTRSSMLGAKGAGEAGTAGAPGAVVNAINDALRPLNAEVWSQPVTPEKILRALGHI